MPLSTRATTKEDDSHEELRRALDKIIYTGTTVFIAASAANFSSGTTLHGIALAHASDRVNPDVFGDGHGQGRRAAPFRRGAGIFEGGH